MFAALATLLLLPLLAMVPTLQPWMPSELLTAVIAIVEGAPAADHLRAATVAVVATLGLLALAMRRLERRELTASSMRGRGRPFAIGEDRVPGPPAAGA